MSITFLWHATIRALQDWWNDNCLRLAASLAYYTALSLAPLVLLIVGVVGLVLDRQPSRLESCPKLVVNRVCDSAHRLPLLPVLCVEHILFRCRDGEPNL